MLKYFVMGIKELKKRTGYCFDCNMKLIIPTWKWCANCDPKIRARKLAILKKELALKMKSIKPSEISNLRIRDGACKDVKMEDVECFMLDENGEVIGFRTYKQKMLNLGLN